MLRVERVGVSPVPLPVGILVGGTAGLVAVLALSYASPAVAVALPLAVLGGVLMLANSWFGLYAVAASLIVFWPPLVFPVQIAALTGSTLLWALTARRRLIPADRVLLLLFLLVIWFVVSVMLHGTPVGFTIHLAYICFLLLYWCVSTLAISSRVIQRLVEVMLLSGIAIALIGLYQSWRPFIWIASAANFVGSAYVNRGIDALETLVSAGAFRVESLAGTADYLGMSMQALLPFAVFWLARQKGVVRRLAGLAMVLLLSSALLLSLTRGVIVSTVCIVVPALATQFGWRRSLPYLLTAVLLGGLAFLAWEPLRARLLSMVTEWTANDIATSGGWRREMLLVGVQILLDHFWFGVGVGRQVEFWPQYAPWEVVLSGGLGTLPIHNGYLIVAIETGLVGLALVVALVVQAWVSLRRARRSLARHGQTALVDLCRAAEVAWIGLAFNVFLYPVLDSTFRYLWLVLALIGGLCRYAADLDAAVREPEQSRG